MEGSPWRSVPSGVDARLVGLDGGELFLLYQVICSTPDRRPVGVEALVRWRHPLHGALAPAVFLPSIFEQGRGRALTEHVLAMAVGQCGAWQRDGLDIPVSVNVSPDVFIDGAVADVVSRCLAHDSVSARCLTIELTEQTCPSAGALHRAAVTMARMGVRLSLDDFGLGESSLRRIQEMQFDELKIDRRFVHHAASVPTDRKIVQFVTALAHSLGIEVVAEGIETAPVFELAGQLGVDRGQGFYLHRPSEAGTIASYFRTHPAGLDHAPPERPALRVVILDDDPHFCNQLRRALESAESPVTVVGEAGTGAHDVELASQLHPDVVLLDVRMPGDDGFSADAILALHPGTPILMLTASDDQLDIARAVEACGSGYLIKERSLDDVLTAVRSIAAGLTWPLALPRQDR